MAKAESQTDDLISNNERNFILDAISEQKRLDGRGLFDYRLVKISFGNTWGRVQVQLGNTRVLVVVSCEVVRPYPDRPTEGFFKFNISFSPMASPAYGGRVSSLGVEIGRIVERGLRESGAIDTEALCIVAGEKVWSVRLDTHVLDDHGNLSDCCGIGAITALHHFRRPDVTISGDAVIVHSIKEREPVQLSIHHMPICISFGIFENGTMIVDPSWKEEKVCPGRMTITLNAQHELCAMQKAGGVALTAQQLLEATMIAQMKVMEISEAIHEALKNDRLKRKKEDVSSSNLMTSGLGLEQVEEEFDPMAMEQDTPQNRTIRFFQGLESLKLPDIQPGDEEYDDDDDDDAMDIEELMSSSVSSEATPSEAAAPPKPAAKKGPIVVKQKGPQKPTAMLKAHTNPKPVVAAKVSKQESKPEKQPAKSETASKPQGAESESDSKQRQNKKSFEQFAAQLAEKNKKKQQKSTKKRKEDSSDSEEEETIILK